MTGQRIYTDHITDPITGENLTFTATTEADLDRQVAEHFSESTPTTTQPPDPTLE